LKIDVTNDRDGGNICRGPTVELWRVLHLRFTAVMPPTEPVHCIYYFGLAVTMQGARQVMLGDKVFNYGPSEYMLTPIDLPIPTVLSKSIWRAADVRSSLQCRCT